MHLYRTNCQKRVSHGLVGLLCAIFVGAAIIRASAITNEWTGTGGDNLWTNPANWTLQVAPDASHQVVIDSTAANGVLLDTTAGVISLELGKAGPAILNITEGLLHCHSDSVVYGGGVINLDGEIELDSIGSPTFIVEGTINWREGSLNALEASTFQLAPTGVLNIQDGDLKRLNGSMLNQGMVSCFATTLDTTMSSKFTNENLFVLHTNLSLIKTGTEAQFQNNGTILVPAEIGVRSLSIGWAFTNRGTITVETNSVLELRPANDDLVYFADGTMFAGPGTLRFPYTGFYFASSGTLTLNTVLEYAGLARPSTGTFWTGSGIFRWIWPESGISDFTFGPGFRVEVADSGPKIFSGACTNLGTIRWLADASLRDLENSSFYNGGEFILESNCLFGTGALPAGSFLNNGTILQPADSGSSQLIIALNFTNQAVIRVETNSTLDFVGWQNGQIHFADGSLLDGSGNVRLLNSFDPFLTEGSVSLNASLECLGPVVSSSHTFWNGSGIFRWSGETLLGDFTFGPEFQVEIQGDEPKSFGGACTNLGTIRWLANTTFRNADDATFNNSGQFIVETNCVFRALPSSPADFVNNGVLDLRNGTLTIEHNLRSTPSSVVKVALGGSVAGNQFSWMVIAGNAPLAGSLIVSLNNGFVPANGDTFAVVNYDSFTGQFSSTQLPTLPGNLSWEVDYGPTAVALKVVSGLNLLSIANPVRLTDGNLRFDVGGSASGALVVQATTNLTLADTWLNVATNVPFTGVYQFTDTEATNFPQRFYRATSLP
jgi:hypothetical protein